MIVAFLVLAALPPSVHINIQSDEPNAVLAILDKRATHQQIAESDWTQLFATEGYVRLKKREHSMQRAFEDDAFRSFVVSDALLARRDVLHRVMRDWRQADLSQAARLALAYLPAGAKIEATIYPVIKPAKNSFVFEGNAIFKYVEEEPREQFETIIAHELHHIGYNNACPPPAAGAASEKLPPNLKALGEWLSAFGEGYATIAAGGGPDHDPQRYAPADVQAAWKSGMRDYDTNFHEVERFFLDILDGRLTGDAIPNRGFEFFGLVGPWYTVGWKMCAVIEKTLGRQALIDAFCDRRTLLETYNRAAAQRGRETGERLPRWDARLVGAFTKPSS